MRLKCHGSSMGLPCRLARWSCRAYDALPGRWQGCFSRPSQWDVSPCHHCFLPDTERVFMHVESVLAVGFNSYGMRAPYSPRMDSASDNRAPRYAAGDCPFAILGPLRNRCQILFPRSERVKTDPRSIGTFGVQFPAVLPVLTSKNVDVSGAQIQPFTSREKY